MGFKGAGLVSDIVSVTSVTWGPWPREKRGQVNVELVT